MKASKQCDTCLQYKNTINNAIYNETCFDKSCKDIGSTNISIKRCLGGLDSLGNPCNCCQTIISTTSNGGLTFCNEEFDFLNGT
jgi:hypothetical protein